MKRRSFTFAQGLLCVLAAGSLLLGASSVRAESPENDEAASAPAADLDEVLVNDQVIAQVENGEIPDLVFAWMVENPTSGITRVPVANAALFGVAPNDRVGCAFVLAPIIPMLFYLVYEPTITADWTASRGDRWTLPLGIGFGRHHRLPKRPRLSLTTRLSGFYNVVRTDRDPKAQLLFALVFWKPNPAVFISD